MRRVCVIRAGDPDVLEARLEDLLNEHQGAKIISHVALWGTGVDAGWTETIVVWDVQPGER